MKLFLATLTILGMIINTSNINNNGLNGSSQKTNIFDNKVQQDTIYITKDGNQVTTA